SSPRRPRANRSRCTATASSRATSPTSTTWWRETCSRWRRWGCRARSSTSPAARATRSSPSPTRSATSSTAACRAPTPRRARATCATRSPTSRRRSGCSAIARRWISRRACAAPASTSSRASGATVPGQAGRPPARARSASAKAPGAPIAHGEPHRLALGRERHLDLHRAPVAVLERVVDQVLDDLLHLHAVGAERREPGRDAAGEPALARGEREGAGLERREQLAERELLAPDGEAPGLQAGDVQRGAEEIDELDRLPLERGTHVALLGGERAEGPLAEQARVADQRVQRRAQVVRHGRERVALHAREPGEPPALPGVDECHAGEGGERTRELEPRVGEWRRPGDDQVERAAQVRPA